MGEHVLIWSQDFLLLHWELLTQEFTKEALKNLHLTNALQKKQQEATLTQCGHKNLMSFWWILLQNNSRNCLLMQLNLHEQKSLLKDINQVSLNFLYTLTQLFHLLNASLFHLNQMLFELSIRLIPFSFHLANSFILNQLLQFIHSNLVIKVS